jgi:hypothetical protein
MSRKAFISRKLREFQRCECRLGDPISPKSWIYSAEKYCQFMTVADEATAITRIIFPIVTA